jgi:hypothetical protein
VSYTLEIHNWTPPSAPLNRPTKTDLPDRENHVLVRFLVSMVPAPFAAERSSRVQKRNSYVGPQSLGRAAAERLGKHFAE